MNVLTNTSCRVIKDVAKRLQSSSTTVSSFDIKIPNRIERRPTDILKALEKTLSRDPTASHYKYKDDPYLIPMSKQEQRYRALSLESGKKAAMWVYREHGDLFARDLADPIIPDFLPPVTYTRKDQVSEEILLKTILEGKTQEALKIYNLLDENVSTKAKLSLLELLCFSNSKDLFQFTFQEERWFTMDGTQKKLRNWKETEEIKKLSEFLMSQDKETAAAAYNALICGKAKFFQIDQAWSMYLKCTENKIPLNVYAYNAIIKIVSLVKGPMNEPHREVFTLLNEMSKNGIHPNIGTLNATFETLFCLKSYNAMLDFAYRLLGEFKVAGVKPSLATYYHLLNVSSRYSESVIPVLSDILDALEKEDILEIRDPNDVNFFTIAIDLARKQYNRDIGERVHRLLLKDGNYKFITNSLTESIYYRQYVLLNLATLPIEEFFKLYDNISMNIYLPEALIFEKIFLALKNHSEDVILKYLPKLWPQMQILHIFEVDKIIKIALNITRNCNLESESPLHETFAKYALDIWNLKQSKISNMRQTLFDAIVLGDIMILLLRASWYEEASNIMLYMLNKDAYVMGALDSKQVNELLEICILNAYGSIALNLIKYMTITGLQDVVVMARKVYNAIPLKATEKEALISLVGNDVLQLQLSNEC